MTLYADDPDLHVRFTITDTAGGTNDFAPTVKVNDGANITAVWVGTPAASRVLDVPLAGVGSGQKRLRLIVPGDNDVDLGTTYIQ